MRNSLFWQWLNQTYNAGLNFGNKNASMEQSNFETVSNYVMAVGCALSMIFGLRRLTSPFLAKHQGSVFGQLINNTVSFCTVATSSAMSLYLTRRGELASGIEVMSPSGQTLGTSKAAAKLAVT